MHQAKYTWIVSGWETIIHWHQHRSWSSSWLYLFFILIFPSSRGTSTGTFHAMGELEGSTHFLSPFFTKLEFTKNKTKISKTKTPPKQHKRIMLKTILNNMSQVIIANWGICGFSVEKQWLMDVLMKGVWWKWQKSVWLYQSHEEMASHPLLRKAVRNCITWDTNVFHLNIFF